VRSAMWHMTGIETAAFVVIVALLVAVAMLA
jgi:hypothetical protein